LLLDGIDEVVKSCPWMCDAIAQLPSCLSNVQLITSSRHIGGFPEKVPLMGLSIRDFTETQKNNFIKKWFSTVDKTDAGSLKAENVIKHLEQNKFIAEIVTNPLNATILCVLAKNEISLPEREIQLYKERTRLLFGDYDFHKEAKRVESRSDLLSKVAIKLAFYLHSHNLREESLDELKAEAVRLFEGRHTVESVNKAVSELVDPCNILVPMNVQGDFGFGHLRFQEYFTACELLTNRNIKLVDLLYYEWWRGPMTLLAQMSDDLEYLFKGAIDRSRLTQALQTLNAMLKDKSEKEVKRLDKWLDKAPQNEEENDEIQKRDYFKTSSIDD
jgi:hypothetical protein